MSLVADKDVLPDSSFISFSSKVDSLTVESVHQNDSFPNEFQASVNNVRNFNYNFRLGQQFGSLSVLLLLLLSSIFSFASG